MPAKPGARCSRHRIPGWGERLRRKPASPSLGLRGRGANDAAAAAAAAAAASTAETRLEMGENCVSMVKIAFKSMNKDTCVLLCIPFQLSEI
ncbi:uncharacterized protein LOC132675820 isoform X2 [Panthera onca]